MINQAICDAFQKSYTDWAKFMNEGGLWDEGVLANPNKNKHLDQSKRKLTFESFSTLGEVTKSLSPISQSLMPEFSSPYFQPLGYKLIEKDEKGYDYIIEKINGNFVCEYEQKMSTVYECLKPSDYLTHFLGNKYSKVKVPNHIFVPVEVIGSKILSIGSILTDITKDHFIDSGNEEDNNGYAPLEFAGNTVKEIIELSEGNFYLSENTDMRLMSKLQKKLRIVVDRIDNPLLTL